MYLRLVAPEDRFWLGGWALRCHDEEDSRDRASSMQAHTMTSLDGVAHLIYGL